MARLPGIATSDSHRIQDVLKSYMRLSGLDFRNSDTLKASLSKSLRQGEEVTRLNGKHEKLRHGLSVAFALGGLKLRFLKRT